MDEDYALALQLQSEYFMENESSIYSNDVGSKKEPKSLVDPYWEMTDPNPDIRALFLQFNERFFWGRLSGIEVKWSPRMTLCAGLCCYEGRGGLCSVRLSVPLLKLRPRKDLVETLLHEMIHAYLFVTDNNKDHDGHGPEFHKHMYRINHEAGTNITVYHNFHDEVDSYRQHWWRCDGPCRSRKPYFGYVKRSMNRAPSKNDTWWAEHQRTCGGTYTKVKEPEDYGKKKSKKGGDKKEKQEKEKSKVKSMDIRIFGGEGKTLGGSKPFGQPSPGSSKSFGKSSNTTALPSTSTVGTGIDINPSSQQTFSKNTEDFPSLPGGRTPDKKVVPRNKPVSQGGGAKFKGSKVKKVIDFDWTDSEDEEILANLSRSQSNDLTNQKRDIPDFSDDSDLEVMSESELMNSQHTNRKECTESSNTNVTFQGQSCDIENEHTVEDVGDDIVTVSVDKDGTTKDEVSDVQAMLRKVWGEKKFTIDKGKRKLGQGYSKSFVISGNPGNQVKRPSGEAGLTEIEHSKKPKLINENSLQSWTESSVSEVKHEHKNTCGKHQSPRKQPQANSVTSPIEKLFNKMREKQPTLRDGQTVSASLGSVKTVNQTADTSSRDNTLMNKKQDGENSSQCPVCCKQVPTATINNHLDLCLTLQEIS